MYKDRHTCACLDASYIFVPQAGWHAWAQGFSCACKSSCCWTLWYTGMTAGWTWTMSGA